MKIQLSIYEPPLNVTREPGSLVRFLVRSECRTKKTEHYLVDLDEPAFPKGWCECQHHEYRLAPRIRRQQPAPEHGVCKHLRRVRSVLEHCRMICEAYGEDPELASHRVPDIWEWEHRRKRLSETA